MAKYDGLGGLNKKDLFSYSSRGWKSKIKELAELVSSEVSLFDLQMVISLSAHVTGVCVCVSKLPLFIKIPVILDWSPP